MNLSSAGLWNNSTNKIYVSNRGDRIIHSINRNDGSITQSISINSLTDGMMGAMLGGIALYDNCANNGDINNDYQINVIDVLEVVCQILQYDDCNIYCNSDMDNNGSINVIDILIVIDLILN